MYTGTLTPASNRATWSENVQIIDAETDEPIDISDVDEITVEVREVDTQSVVLTATMTGGDITILEADDVFSVFQWRFEEASMRSLDPKTYEIGCVAEKDSDTIQLIVATIPIIDGIVS